MGKFKLYSIRNIFTPSQRSGDLPVPAPVVSSSSSSANSSAKDNAHNEMDRTLESLRQRYIVLQKDYLQVATECRDMDALLKDMRSALFNLRVAIQSFEDYEISPLSETTNILHQYKARLRECSDDATSKSHIHLFIVIHVLIDFTSWQHCYKSFHNSLRHNQWKSFNNNNKKNIPWKVS